VSIPVESSELGPSNQLLELGEERPCSGRLCRRCQGGDEQSRACGNNFFMCSAERGCSTTVQVGVLRRHGQRLLIRRRRRVVGDLASGAISARGWARVSLALLDILVSKNTVAV